MKLLLSLLIFLILAGTPSHAAAMSDFSIDNSAAVGGVSEGGGSPDTLMGVWGQISKDPPKTFQGFIEEYRSTSGGPMASLLGVNPFKLQNLLVKSFAGFLLLIFCGAAVLQGLQKGELNVLSLAVKLMLGIIILFHPEFVYAAGRTIQTAGQSLAIASMAVAKNSAIAKAIEAADVGKLSAGAIEAKAAEQAQASIAGYIFNDGVERAISAVKAFNKNKAGLQIEPADKKDKQAVNARAGEALALAGPAINADDGYKTAIADLRQKYDSDMAAANGDSAKRDQIQKQYLMDVSKAATEAAYGLYGVGVDDRIYDATIGKIDNWQKNLNDFLTNSLASFLIPLAIFILTRLAALVLELCVILVVVMFPFFMLESTAKSWTGTLQTFFAAALVPAVGIVLLIILEGVMAMLAKIFSGTQEALKENFFGAMISGGTTQIGFSIVFVLLWIAGLAFVCWMTPKITKSLMAGGSWLGAITGGMMMAGAAAGMSAIGIGALAMGNVGGLGALAKAKKGLGGGTSAALGLTGGGGQMTSQPTARIPAPNSISGSGESGESSAIMGGGSGGGAGSAGSAQIPEMQSKSSLNKTSLAESPEAKRMEDRIAAQNYNQAGASGILGPDGKPISSESLKKGSSSASGSRPTPSSGNIARSQLADAVKNARIEYSDNPRSSTAKSGSGTPSSQTIPASTTPGSTSATQASGESTQQQRSPGTANDQPATQTQKAKTKPLAGVRSLSKGLPAQILQLSAKTAGKAMEVAEADDEVTQATRKGIRQGQAITRNLRPHLGARRSLPTLPKVSS